MMVYKVYCLYYNYNNINKKNNLPYFSGALALKKLSGKNKKSTSNSGSRLNGLN